MTRNLDMPKKADNVPARLPLDVFAAEQVRFRAFRLNKVFKPLGEKGRGRALFGGSRSYHWRC